MAATTKTNPWRRGPAQSQNGIPISAQTAVPLAPRGPGAGFGFFTPPTFNHVKTKTSPAPGKIPISAVATKVKNGRGV